MFACVSHKSYRPHDQRPMEFAWTRARTEAWEGGPEGGEGAGGERRPSTLSCYSRYLHWLEKRK